MFTRDQPIAHQLSQHYRALGQIRTRKKLLASPLWREIGGEIERVTAAIERADFAPATTTTSENTAREKLRVVAWNIQRGRRFESVKTALLGDPRLSSADVICLVEVDSGMGRSGNRNVARELAAALGMSYAFGVSYLVLEDDYGENPDAAPNQLALAGTAILSRLPILSVENVDLPELRDKFSSSEKRLGKKRALICRVQAARPITIGACHLDSNASPAGRAQQLAVLLERAEKIAGEEPLLVAGDFNTTTYDLSSPWALAKNLAHKLFKLGFVAAVNQYMTPEQIYERPVFELLQKHRLSVEEFNERAVGSLHYDINDEYALQKSRKLVGRALTRLLVRKLRPWNGRVPARLDWIAARGLHAIGAATVEPPAASDHAAVVVDLRP